MNVERLDVQELAPMSTSCRMARLDPGLPLAPANSEARARDRLVRVIRFGAVWCIFGITSRIWRSFVYRSHRAIEST